MKSKIIPAALAAVTCCSLAAPAPPRHEAHAPPPHYSTPHWVFDGRYHHNHYYPAPGYAVTVLPPGNVAVHFRGGQFWFHAGVWYQHVGPRYVVVRPPVGIIVPVLPPAYSVVYYSGLPYYYADDVYYVQEPSGYEVVAPPDPAAPSQAPGTWYYCPSAKAYYPYASQCPEGWKAVPAAPPPSAPQ